MNWPWQESKFELEMKLALGQVNSKLVDFEEVLGKIYKKVKIMAEAMDALNAQVDGLIAAVASNTDVVQSAVIAITGLTDQQAILTQQLQDAIDSTDFEQVQAITDELVAQNNLIVANTAALAAAIPENAPAVK